MRAEGTHHTLPQAWRLEPQTLPLNSGARSLQVGSPEGRGPSRSFWWFAGSTDASPWPLPSCPRGFSLYLCPVALCLPL